MRRSRGPLGATIVAAVAALAATAIVACESDGAGEERADPMANVTRDADGTTVRSDRWPPVAVRVDGAFRYIGSRTIRLGAGAAEIHLLVDTLDSAVRRFYWIQFEGYPPDSPNRYDYSDLPHRDTVDGYLFHADVRYGAYTAAEVENEPDTGTVGAILAEHGYDFPAPMMRARMVTLDAPRRNELLIIYMEALEWSGAALKELKLDGSRWAEVSAGLRERAIGGLELVGGE